MRFALRQLRESGRPLSPGVRCDGGAHDDVLTDTCLPPQSNTRRTADAGDALPLPPPAPPYSVYITSRHSIHPAPGHCTLPCQSQEVLLLALTRTRNSVNPELGAGVYGGLDEPEHRGESLAPATTRATQPRGPTSNHRQLRTSGLRKPTACMPRRPAHNRTTGPVGRHSHTPHWRV